MEKEQDRLSLGLSNELDVERVRLSLVSNDNDIKATEREWFLTLLEYQLAAGEDLEKFLLSVLSAI